MSITATIDDPKNAQEEEFDVPVCTETIYQNLILPIATRCSLALLAGWGEMVEITLQKMPEFIEQLKICKTEISIDNSIEIDTKNYICGRLDNLETQVKHIMNDRGDAVILIG